MAAVPATACRGIAQTGRVMSCEQTRKSRLTNVKILWCNTVATLWQRCGNAAANCGKTVAKLWQNCGKTVAKLWQIVTFSYSRIVILDRFGWLQQRRVRPPTPRERLPSSKRHQSHAAAAPYGAGRQHVQIVGSGGPTTTLRRGTDRSMPCRPVLALRAAPLNAGCSPLPMRHHADGCHERSICRPCGALR